MQLQLQAAVVVGVSRRGEKIQGGERWEEEKFVGEGGGGNRRDGEGMRRGS
jgi:hypothetical protein